MSSENEIKQIMIDAIKNDKEAGKISIRTAAYVVRAIYDALKKAKVISKSK